MENKVKLQHFVPKVYLKYFANQSGKDYYIWCFDKETQKIFRANIDKIARQEEFYEGIKENQILENEFRNIESQYDKVIEKIISSRNPDELSLSEKEIISKFISYQMIRTPEVREEVKDAVKQLYDKVKGQKMSKEFETKIINSMKEESIREIHQGLIKDVGEFNKRIINLKWILILNKSIFPFWTSDNPVVKFNRIDHSPYGNLGLESLGIEIYFPVTPNLMLVVCDPRKFGYNESRKVTRDYRNIIFYRDLQVRDSTRFVFSNEDKFAFARMMLKEHPELGDPNRKRVKVE